MKKVGFIFSAIVLGVFLGFLRDLNLRGMYQTQVETLKTRLSVVEGDLQKSQEQLKQISLLRYKDMVFKKKFPQFCNIVEAVFNKSLEYGFDPDLIMSIIEVESNFNPAAVSAKGAFGLMQIKYSIWKDVLNINWSKICDIEYNINLGLQILKHYYLVAGGDLDRALHLYNNGFLYNHERYRYRVMSSRFYPEMPVLSGIAQIEANL